MGFPFRVRVHTHPPCSHIPAQWSFVRARGWFDGTTAAGNGQGGSRLLRALRRHRVPQATINKRHPLGESWGQTWPLCLVHMPAAQAFQRVPHPRLCQPQGRHRYTPGHPLGGLVRCRGTAWWRCHPARPAFCLHQLCQPQGRYRYTPGHPLGGLVRCRGTIWAKELLGRPQLPPLGEVRRAAVPWQDPQVLARRAVRHLGRR